MKTPTRGEGKDVGSRALWQYFDEDTAVRI